MSALNTLLQLYRIEKANPVRKKVANSFSFFKAKVDKDNNKGILLVQLVRTYDYAVKLAAASKALAEKKDLYVNLYTVDLYWSKKEAAIFSVFKWLKIDSIIRVFKKFGNQVVFYNSAKYKDQTFIQKKLDEIKNTLGETDIDGLLNLKFEDVLVGDLIYDTYLRFYHKPVLERIDENVLKVISLGLNIFYNFNDFIKNNNIKALLNTYTTYLQHGIPARICLKSDIEVYTLGSTSYFIQKATPEFPYHQINHTLFDVAKPLKPEQIKAAKNQFEVRFKGKIDPATSYMRKSAYANSETSPELKEKFKLRKRNVVIYAHDFFDSPHINRCLQFPNLYEYLKQTLAALTGLTDTTVFVKLHPNGITGCKEIAIDLINGFNCAHFVILDELVSNLNIVELKPDLVGSGRGTICVEMAYFGIPTVALYDNLYVKFNFVHICMTKDEYYAVLKGESQLNIDFDREKIFSFYYQAFMEKRPIHKRNVFDIFESFKGEFFSDEYLEYLLSSSYMNDRGELVSRYAEALALY